MGELRLYRPDERAYVGHSWLMSFRDSDLADIAREAYSAGQERLVDSILDRPATWVRVCERDNIIAGWLCGEGDSTLHYAYVRQLYRRSGVARALVGELAQREVAYSHKSLGLRSARLPSSWRYDPYAAWVPVTYQRGAA